MRNKRHSDRADGRLCCEYYAGDDDMALASQDMFVNAWMELPEKYRDGSE